MKYFLYILLFYSMFVWAQQPKPQPKPAQPNPTAQLQALEERMQNLELRLAALEDYIKNQIAQILDQKAQDFAKSVTTNQESWQTELSATKEELKRAQIEIMQLKITLARIQRAELENLNSSGTTKIPAISENTTGAKPDGQQVNSTTEPQNILGQPNTNINQPQTSPTSDNPTATNDPQFARLIAQLRSPESSLRISAVLQLNRMENPEATRALITALHDDDPYVRMMICRCLGKRKDKSAISGLLDLQLDSNLEVRTFAAQALQDITQSANPFPYRAQENERKQAITEWRKKWCKE